MRVLDIIKFPSFLQGALDSITTILRITKQHLRTWHEEHWVRYVSYNNVNDPCLSS